MTLAIEPYEVGKVYRVPVARGFIEDIYTDWPVLGPQHEDSEIIDFEPEHFHVDWRFVGERNFRTLGGWSDTRRILGLVVYQQASDPRPLVSLGGRHRICKRAFPEWPSIVHWKPALESAYRDKTIGPALICPHRGASLQGLEVKDGCVTCPLHGLKWNCETGRLVTQ